MTAIRRRRTIATFGLLVAMTASACTTETGSPVPVAPPTPPATTDGPGTDPSTTPVPEAPSDIWVAADDDAASDDNLGSSVAPLATIQAAADRARARSDQGEETTIHLRPGTYREKVRLGSDGDEAQESQGPITIQGEGDGPADVIITGADEAEATPAADGLFEIVWDGAFDAADLPEGWDGGLATGHLEDEPLLRRREMVFVDGVRLLPRSTRLEVADEPGTFALLGNDDRLVFQPPDGAAPDASVEVARRDSGLFVIGRRGVTIRDLTVQHVATPLERRAVTIFNSRDVTLEDVHVLDNSWFGVGMSTVVGATLRRVVADGNGSGGITGFMLDDLVLEDSQTNRNGWRVALSAPGTRGVRVLDASLMDFASGQKFFRLRGATFLRHRSQDNASNGLWLDYDNVDVVVEDVVLTGNGTQGLFIEASQGPVEVRGSTVCGNETGMLLSMSERVTLVGNVIGDNALAQVALTGQAPRRVFSRDAGELQVQDRDWDLTGNVVVARDGQRGMASVGLPWSQVEQLRADDNQYLSTGTAAMFEVDADEPVDFATWQGELDVDPGSTHGPATVGCPG